MDIRIKPSDLFYRYPKNHLNKRTPGFTGKPDARPFDKDDLFEVIPVLEAIMNHIESNDGALLREIEEVLVRWMPADISREQAFEILREAAEQLHRP